MYKEACLLNMIELIHVAVLNLKPCVLSATPYQQRNSQAAHRKNQYLLTSLLVAGSLCLFRYEREFGCMGRNGEVLA